MNSDGSESGNDGNPHNGEYNEDQITEPLFTCLQKITMNLDSSESEDEDSNPQNGEFNKDQIKELIAFLIKITNILSQPLKSNTKHKGRKLMKKRNRAKVYNAHNEIGKLCNTFKNIGCSVNDNQAEGPTSKLSLAEAVAGTCRSQIPAVAGTSRSNTESILGTFRRHTEAIPGTSMVHREAIPGTSSSHTEAIPGTSRVPREAIPGTSSSHTEAIPGTFRIHTEPAVTEKSTPYTIPVVGTPRGNTDANGTGTPKSQAPALAGNCKNHIGAVPVTSRSHNEPIVGKSRTDTDVIAVNSRKNVKPTDGGSRILTLAVPVASLSLTDTVPGASRSHINAASGSSRSHTDAVPAASRCHTDPVPVAHRSTDVVPGASRSIPDSAPAASRSHTDAVHGESRRLTDVVPETCRRHSETLISHVKPVVSSRSHTEAIPKTSASRIEAITGTSKSQTEATPGIHADATETTSHTKNVNPETSLVGSTNSSSLTEQRAETAKSRMKSIVRRNSSIQIEYVPGTSRNNTEAVNPDTPSRIAEQCVVISKTARGTSRHNAETVSSGSRRVTGTVVPQATRNQSKDMLAISQSNSKSVNSAIPSLVATSMSDTLRNHIEHKLSTPSRNRRIVEESETIRREKQQKNVNISGDDIRQKECTNLLSNETKGNASNNDIIDKKRNNETSLKMNHVNSNRVDSIKRVLCKDNVCPGCGKVVHTRSGDRNLEQLQKSLCCKISQSQLDRLNADSPRLTQTQILDQSSQQSAAYDTIAEPTEGLTPDAALFPKITLEMLTDEISLEIPEEPGRFVRKRKWNSPTAKITDMDILRNQAGANKNTANRHIEQGSAISSLTKITHTHKDNKSIDGRKMKSNENCALNGRTEETVTNSTPTKIADAEKSTRAEDFKKIKTLRVIEKPVSTTKVPIEQAISNSTPIKTAENDKENKSVDEKKRKTKAKDYTKNAHVERVITNCNDKQAADAKKRPATRPDKSDSMRNERLEETMSNSTLTKMSDTKKAKEPMNGKKRKVLGADFGYTTIDLTSGNDIDNSKSPTGAFKKGSPGPAEVDKKIKDEPIIDLSDDTCFYNPAAEKNQSVKVIPDPVPKSEDNDKVLKDQQVIDVDEDNGLNDLTQEEFTTKKIKDEPIIDLSDDTCFYNQAAEKNQSIKVIPEPVPKSEDNDQLLKNQQIIDVDEDTCLYDRTQEEFTITNAGPKSRDHDQILKDQPVIDLSEDTCSYEVSQQKTSEAIKKITPNTKCDDEQVTNSTNIINEICRSDGENVSATNKESNKKINEDRTKRLHEREVKYAEYLLAGKVKKEQASKDPGSSNTVVVSSFFSAPPDQNNQKSNHKISEQNATQIKQRLQGNFNSLKKLQDKVKHASKRPYKKSKNDKNKLKPNKNFPDFTITTKTPDACVATSPTIPTQQKQKTIQPSSERHNSNDPVNEPELSISIRPTPNRRLTYSAIESIVMQAAQIAIPDLSITTSAPTLQYRTSTMENPLAKLNPVTSEPFRKRDETIPGGQQTNPIQTNANIHQNNLIPSDRSAISLYSMQNIAESDCGLSDVTKTAKRPTTDSGSFSKRHSRSKSREQPTTSFEKKAQTVPPTTLSETSSSTKQQSAQITRTDSSSFSSTPAESRPGKPKPVTKASNRPSPDSGRFPQPRESYPIQNGKHNQAPAFPEWTPAPWTALLSQSQHHPSGNIGMLSTNHFDATRQPTNPKSVSTSQGSPKLALSPPQICSGPRKDSNPNRRETNFNNVQCPQIDWYQPLRADLTPHGSSRTRISNVSEHSNRKSSTKNHRHPIQSWHTPVLSGNETPDLPQTVSHPPSSHQSSLPHHLRLRALIQEQSAFQTIPTGRPMADQLKPPLRPLLVPKNQAAMMDNQRAPIATQPTWHIPTEATDI